MKEVKISVRKVTWLSFSLSLFYLTLAVSVLSLLFVFWAISRSLYLTEKPVVSLGINHQSLDRPAAPPLLALSDHWLLRPCDHPTAGVLFFVASSFGLLAFTSLTFMCIPFIFLPRTNLCSAFVKCIGIFEILLSFLFHLSFDSVSPSSWLSHFIVRYFIVRSFLVLSFFTSH